MIDGLVSGKLAGKPVARTGATSGKPFVTAKLRAATGKGEMIHADCIAFRESARAALLALEDGDSVALAGEMTPKAWTDREGQPRASVDVVVHGVLSAYHVRRKRQAIEGEHG
ncbi:MAG: single-stranded DNA-binding protein [Nevskiaceae bacterium]|jgi:single-stranded DNA-binding protein|nr:single-stranded DNA-binding protein [Nevskiaceae bacterium]